MIVTHIEYMLACVFVRIIDILWSPNVKESVRMMVDVMMVVIVVGWWKIVLFVEIEMWIMFLLLVVCAFCNEDDFVIMRLFI